MAQPFEKSPSTIVLVDDDFDIRSVTKEILKIKGYLVRDFERSVDAIEHIRLSRPDLILCDIAMPEMDGFELRKVLIDDSELANIPFVFVTAKTGRESQRSGMKLGAVDYLTKPFSIRELTDVVETCITRSETVFEQLQEKANQLREELLLIFPHEINTPLSQLRMCIYLMSSPYNSLGVDKRDEVLSSMAVASDRLEAISSQFRDILSFVLVEGNDGSNNSFFATERYDLEESLTRFLSGPQYTDDDQRRLDASFEPVLSAVAKPLLERCLFELVSNGLIHTTGRIVINGIGNADSYVILIQDEGAGFEEKALTSVDLFRQFEAPSRQRNGLGLGIATARRLAQGFGGELTIDSNADSGTKCCLKFPITHLDLASWELPSSN